MVAQRILPLGHHLFIGQKQGWCNTRFSDPSVPAPFAPRCQNAGNAQFHAHAKSGSDQQLPDLLPDAVYCHTFFLLFVLVRLRKNNIA